MNKKYLYMLATGHLSVDINSGSFPALLPFFVAEYGMDYTAIAGLMFAYSLVSSVIQPIFGALADKGSRQWFMSFGIILSGTALASMGFITDYWSIFIAAALMGIGSAIFHPEAARNVNAIAGTKKGQGMSIFSVGGNAGFGFGPLVAVFLVTTFGMKGLAFYFFTALIMSSLVLAAAPKIRQATENAREELRAASGRPVESVGINDWHAFTRLFFVILFRSTTLTAISSFLPLFCIEVLGASKALGSLTLSIISIAGVVATLIGGWVADRCGYVNTLRYGCFLLVPCLAIVALSHNLWAVFLMLIPMSFGIQGTYSAFIVLGQSYLAKNIGFASGVTMGLSFSLGGIIAPSLGFFADSYGLESVMLLILGIAICSALATLSLPPIKNVNN